MSLAAETRDAVRARPVLYDALRAGIVNYTAAADTLDLDGETEAVATALRRYAESLDATENGSKQTESSTTVRMESGLSRVAADGLLLSVDGRGFAVDSVASGSGQSTIDRPDEEASLTAIHAASVRDQQLVATVLRRLDIADIEVQAVGSTAESMVVIVGRRDGVNALRLVESALR